MNTSDGANETGRSDHGVDRPLQRRLRSVDPTLVRADLFAASEAELVELLGRILGDSKDDDDDG